MVIYGALFGALIIFIDSIFLKGKKFRLHLMPLAVGIYLPVTLAIPIFIGGLIRYFIDKKLPNRDESKNKGVLLGSGFIAGEAIMGVVIAIVIYNFGDILVVKAQGFLVEIFSIVAFCALTSYLYRVAKK